MSLEQVGNDMKQAVESFCLSMSRHIDSLERFQPNFSYPWDRDIVDQLARNPGPYTEPSLEQSGGWWQRRLDQIVGVTIHHTLSDSPHALAEYYVKKGGGRPSIPYTIWVTQTGEVLKCLDLKEACWHDHTGHRNVSLSVGLAGSLHKYAPPDVQLRAAARVCAWAIRSGSLPSVNNHHVVRGHLDVYKNTVCPGWLGSRGGTRSGYWRPRFYDFLRGALA